MNVRQLTIDENTEYDKAFDWLLELDKPTLVEMILENYSDHDLTDFCKFIDGSKDYE